MRSLGDEDFLPRGHEDWTNKTYSLGQVPALLVGSEWKEPDLPSRGSSSQRLCPSLIWVLVSGISLF